MSTSEDEVEKLLITLASSDRKAKASQFTVGTLTHCLEAGLVQQVGGKVNITQHGSEVLQEILIRELSSSQDGG